MFPKFLSLTSHENLPETVLFQFMNLSFKSRYLFIGLVYANVRFIFFEGNTLAKVEENILLGKITMTSTGPTIKKSPRLQLCRSAVFMFCFSAPLKSPCDKNQVFTVIYISMWCLWYALRQTMCKFISQHHCCQRVDLWAAVSEWRQGLYANSYNFLKKKHLNMSFWWSKG